MTRPTKADLAAAYGRTIPDVLAPGLSVVFCGINPGLWSAAVGQHFGRPGNRFWPALHHSGFTPRQFAPAEQKLLPQFGLGITNLVQRATARADELTTEELRAGGVVLAAKLERLRPRWLAVLGVTAYRQAFGERAAATGPQASQLGGTGVWVLPNPSGLNAHYTAGLIAEHFADLRTASGRPY